MALYHRDLHGGQGQLVDVNLIEPLARLIESADADLRPARGHPDPVGQPPRRQCAAQRVSHGRRQVDGHLGRVTQHRRAGLPRRGAARHGAGPRPGRRLRQTRAAEIDDIVAGWVARHTLEEAMAVFEEADVAAAPVYDAAQLLADEHLRARGTFVSVRRSGPRPRHRAGPGGAPERHPGQHRAPGPGAGRRQRRRVRWAPRRRAPTTGRAARKPGSSDAGASEPRARRSELATPASSEKMCVKAAASDADLVFLDLEDACAPVAKEQRAGPRCRR